GETKGDPMSNEISRRGAIASMAALSAAGVVASAASAKGSRSRFASNAPLLSMDDLGWDAKTGEYVLPELPYAYDALSSVIDEETMRIHHGKHHQGYVNGVNAALKALEAIRWDTG